MTSSSKTIVERQPDQPQDQLDVIAFLGSPSTYGADVDKVDLIETHGALVFLAGTRVYKLKRAVRFSYMDFSTLEKRAAACRNEVDRNKATAPDIYIGVLPVMRRDNGELALGGAGVPVDWVAVMNRFDQDDLFDHLASHGKLPISQMPALAEQIAEYHTRARILRSLDGSNILANVVTQIVASLFEAGETLNLDRVQDYAGLIVRELNTQSPTLRSRSQNGLVRLCHGDLHLRNIVLYNGRPTLFDAIEFDDRLATIDVLYDLTFLLMDLWHRDLKEHANLCFGNYVSEAVSTKALDGLAALPLFLSVRAAIRAMVAIDKLAVIGEMDRQASLDDINDYFSLARQFLAPSKPSLVVVGGLSGAGKTTVSAAVAPSVGRAPGALHLRSDVERKRMAGINPLDRLPREVYSKSASDKVYKRLCDRAEQALRAGHSVVVDAVFQDAKHRRCIEQVAARAHAPFLGVWLEASQERLIERVAGRQCDASDADASVVLAQFARRKPVSCWQTVDASGDHNDVVLQVETALHNLLGEL
jgi:aminoglycoside phosphotransferase family enzyme/predicted kinase